MVIALGSIRIRSRLNTPLEYRAYLWSQNSVTIAALCYRMTSRYCFLSRRLESYTHYTPSIAERAAGGANTAATKAHMARSAQRGLMGSLGLCNINSITPLILILTS